MQEHGLDEQKKRPEPEGWAEEIQKPTLVDYYGGRGFIQVRTCLQMDGTSVYFW